MKGEWLLLRAHRTAAAAGLIVLCGIGAAFLGAISYQTSPESPFLMPALYVAPIVPAAIIGATSGTPLVDQEASAQRPMRVIRSGLVMLLVLLAFVCQVIGCMIASSGAGAVTQIRNVLGFTGLALIGSFIIGPPLSVMVPVVAATVPFFFFPDPHYDQSEIWTFYGQPDASMAALSTALVLFVIGFVVCGIRLNPNRAFGAVGMPRSRAGD